MNNIPSPYLDNNSVLNGHDSDVAAALEFNNKMNELIVERQIHSLCNLKARCDIDVINSIKKMSGQS